MAPVSNKMAGENVPEKYGYDLIYSSKVDDIIPVKKYKSLHTGLTVCIADVQGPLVNGYFCLATEIHDDNGLPHTLEHLVFLGSELYPYKGILDLLANRCLASGTGAWTDTDHTCYNLTTAGSSGFLTLLPIYLDHILYPTLSDTGFVTEIHHINGSGEDAGVVYWEMQGRENTGENRIHLGMVRALYKGNSGYQYESGGLLKNLRENTNVDQVRAYHRTYYRPENLCIIITGRVNEDEVFQALKPVEGRILAKGERPKFSRPWQTKVPPLLKSVDQEVVYPSVDEDHGMVYVAWRAAKANDVKQYLTLNLLLDYLTDTAVSPLQQVFVENEDPISSKVKYGYNNYSESYMYLIFENVPTRKLQTVKSRLFNYLSKLADGSVTFDMGRMKTVIKRRILNILSGMESNPQEIVAKHLIADFLYGTSKETLDAEIKPIIALRLLEDELENYWLDVLKRVFVNGHSVTTVGTPSRHQMEILAEQENGRVLKYREALGEKGLKHKAIVVKEATRKNEVQPPERLLTEIPLPSLTAISFLEFHRSSNRCPNTPDSNATFPLSKLPHKFHLDDIQSNFVQIYAVLDTACLTSNLRVYLPLCLEVLLQSPIFHNTDDGFSSYESVVKQLSEDTIEVSTFLGLSDGAQRFSTGPYAQAAVLYLKVEIPKYDRAVKWVFDLLNMTQFVEERVRAVASRMLNDVSHQKRRGYKVTETVIHDLCFRKDSNKQVNSMLRQQRFLGDLLKRLDKDPMKVIGELEEVRCLLTKDKNITVHVATNVERLVTYGDPREAWLKRFSKVPLREDWISDRWVSCSDLVNKPALGQSVVAGIGTVESSFLVQCVPSLSDFNHPDYPALLVFLQYMTQLEGPLWREVRGLGLTHGYNMPLRVSEGLLYLTLYRSSHVVAAFKQAHSVLASYLSGKEKLQPALLESAKNSLIFQLIEKEKCVSDLALQSLLMYFRDVDQHFTKKLLKQVSEVSLADVVRVGPQYVSQLFDTGKSWAVVCCPPSKVDEIEAGLKGLSKDFDSIKSVDDSYLSMIYAV